MFCAVTVYCTGFVKSCAVSDCGETVANGETSMLGFSAVTSVPNGTFRVMFVPEMVAEIEP